MSPSTNALNKSQSGVQSLETGLSLLDVLIEHNEPMMLKDIAQALQMPPAKSHRYLVSLIRKGYARQHDDGRYGLGSRVIALGYAGLNQNNVFERLTQVANEIKDALSCGVQIAKWFSEGPIVIHLVEPDSPISIITRMGSRMPLTTSATGRLFASYQPDSVIKPLVLTEWQNSSDAYSTRWQEFDQLRADIRNQGYSAVTGVMLMGINAICIPITMSSSTNNAENSLSSDGQFLEYAITVIGTNEQLPANEQHQIAKKIVAIAQGYQMA